MLQTLNYLKKVCDEYNKLFLKIEFVPVQKAYIGPHYLNLVLRFPGATTNLLIGLGERCEGIELSDSSLPSLIRQRDRFLDFIRKNLVGTKIGKVQTDPSFRRLRFVMLANSEVRYFDLMWLERVLYFSWQAKNITGEWEHFCSWKGTTKIERPQSLQDVFSEFTNQVDPAGNQEQEYQPFLVKNYVKSILLQHKPNQEFSKSKKFLEKKAKNIRSDLGRFRQRDSIKQELIDDKIKLDEKYFDLCGIKIKFKEDDSYYQRKNLIFQKIKNLDQVESLLQNRLKDVETILSKSSTKMLDEKVKLAVTQPHWGQNDRKGVQTTKSSVYRILTFEFPSKLRVRISLDARSNDELRSTSAKDHLWFHQEIGAGAHLVAKTERFDQLLSEDLFLIASLIHHYSKLTGNEVGLMYSTVKELRGLKGSVGMVTVKKPKYLTVFIGGNWRDKLIEIS